MSLVSFRRFNGNRLILLGLSALLTISALRIHRALSSGPRVAVLNLFCNPKPSTKGQMISLRLFITPDVDPKTKKFTFAIERGGRPFASPQTTADLGSKVRFVEGDEFFEISQMSMPFNNLNGRLDGKTKESGECFTAWGAQVR